MRYLLLLAAALPAVPTVPNHSAYQRTVHAPQATTACLILDPQIYPHAAPGLADLRLYAGTPSAGQQEIPYVTTVSSSAFTPPDPALILNLRSNANHLTFTLQMPPRPYTELTLDLAAQNFLATARVSGLRTLTDTHPTPLTTHTLFDLTAQHLSRSTTIPLQESTYPYLRLDLTFTLNQPPAILRSATVAQSREAQTLYTPIAQTTQLATGPHSTFARLALPAHIPAERLAFTLLPGPQPNFSRPVLLTASAASATPEGITGQITHIHLTTPPPIDLNQLTIPATLAANSRAPAEVEVTVRNGTEPTAPISAISLEMRQRKLCFAPPPGTSALTLRYGDPTLKAPAYSYARLFNPTQPAAEATLGPEQSNPDFHPAPITLGSYQHRHPELLALALIFLIATFAVVVYRKAASTSAK